MGTSRISLPIVVLFVLIIMVIAIYAPGLFAGLTGWQDTRIINGDFGPQDGPLTMLSYALDRFFWSRITVGYHLTNLILHLWSLLLVFLIIRHLWENEWAALAGAVVWALHPIQVAHVIWLGGRAGLLGSCLVLAGFYLYVISRQTGSLYYYASALLLYTLALACTPATWGLVLLLILYEVCFLATERRTWYYYCPFGLIAIMGWAWWLCWGEVTNFRLLGSLAAWPSLFSWQVNLPVLAVAHPTTTGLIRGMYCWGAVLLVAAGGYWAYRGAHPVVAFVLGWWGLALLPWNLVDQGPTLQGLSWPLLALALSVAGVSVGISTWRWLKDWMVAVGLVILLALLSFGQVSVWCDGLSLWSYAHKYHCKYAPYQVYLAHAHLARAQLLARKHAKKSLYHHACQAYQLYWGVRSNVQGGMALDVQVGLARAAACLYQAKSRAPQEWYVGSVAAEARKQLAQGRLATSIQQLLAQQGAPLPDSVSVSVNVPGGCWLIIDPAHWIKYVVRQEHVRPLLHIYRDSTPDQQEEQRLLAAFKRVLNLVANATPTAGRSLVQLKRLQADLHYERGLLYVQLGRLAPARDDYRCAINLVPNQLRYCLALVQLDMQQKQYDSATKQLQAILKRVPDCCEARLLLARLAQCRQKPAKALKILGAILQQHAGQADALYQMACLYEEQFNQKQCRRCLELLVARHPEDVRGWHQLARWWEQKKDYQQAEYCYRKALALTPEDYSLRQEYARFYLKQGFHESQRKLYDLAEQLYQQALQIDDRNTEVLLEMALLYKTYYVSCIAAGEHERAQKLLPRLIALLQKALILKLRSAQINLELGHAYLFKLHATHQQSHNLASMVLHCFEQHLQTANVKTISEFALLYVCRHYRQQGMQFYRQHHFAAACQQWQRAVNLIDQALELLQQTEDWQSGKAHKMEIHLLRAGLLKQLGLAAFALHQQKARQAVMRVKGPAARWLRQVPLYYEKEPNALYQAYREWGRYLATMPADAQAVTNLRGTAYEMLRKLFLTFFTLGQQAVQRLRSAGHQEQDRDEAIRFFRLAARTFPEALSAKPLYLSAVLCYQKGGHRQNIPPQLEATFLEVLKRLPSFYKAHFYLAQIYYRTERLVAARQHLLNFLDAAQKQHQQGTQDQETEKLVGLATPLLTKIETQLQNVTKSQNERK